MKLTFLNAGIRTIICLTITLLMIGLLNPVSAQVSTVEYGQLVQGTVADSSRPVIYGFKATAGDTVSLSAMAANSRVVDLRLDLYDPFHNEMSSQQDDTNSNAIIQNFYIPRDGTYEVDVWSSTGAGDFNLTVNLNSSAANREVVFQDDFSDNSADWAIGGEEGVTGAIQDGKYVVDVNCQSDVNAWFGAMDLSGGNAAPIFDKDFVAEVQVQFAQAEGEAKAGWVFAVQPPGTDNLSVLYYQTDATWKYSLFDTLTQAFLDTTGNTKRKVSMGDGKIHQLGLSVTNPEVRMWIDGQQVARFSATNPLPGTIGLAGGCAESGSMKTIHLEFDNLVVTEVK